MIFTSNIFCHENTLQQGAMNQSFYLQTPRSKTDIPNKGAIYLICLQTHCTSFGLYTEYFTQAAFYSFLLTFCPFLSAPCLSLILPVFHALGLVTPVTEKKQFSFPPFILQAKSYHLSRQCKLVAPRKKRLSIFQCAGTLWVY